LDFCFGSGFDEDVSALGFCFGCDDGHPDVFGPCEYQRVYYSPDNQCCGKVVFLLCQNDFDLYLMTANETLILVMSYVCVDDVLIEEVVYGYVTKQTEISFEFF